MVDKRAPKCETILKTVCVIPLSAIVNGRANATGATLFSLERVLPQKIKRMQPILQIERCHRCTSDSSNLEIISIR